MAIVSGSIAGILGLTGTLGVLSYIVGMALARACPPRPPTSSHRAPQTSAGVFLKLGGDVSPYFPSWCAAPARARRLAARPPLAAPRAAPHAARRKSFCLDGVFDPAMTYLLFWTCVRGLALAWTNPKPRRSLVYNLVHLY